MKTPNITHNILETSVNGFDIRIVHYEKIHNIRQEDFNKLVKIIDPQDNDIILDGGSGYGAVSREILYSIPADLNLKLHLLDISPVQLKRATDELLNINLTNVDLNFVHDSLVHPHYHDFFFDKVVCKMVIHEISKENQQLAINEIFRILKNEGKFVTWDLMLDENTQVFFQNIIRKKDELAGYNSLAKNRYFLKENQWIEILRIAGFKEIKKETDVLYELHSKDRLKHELNNDKSKLDEWNNYIREEAQKISTETLRKLNYFDLGDDITFTPPKSIISAKK